MRVRSALAAAVMSLGASQNSAAADLPVKAPVRPLVAAYNWTGCTVGGHVGGLWADKDWTLRDPGPKYDRPLGDDRPDSWLAGGQLGCSYQLDDRVVIGIRGDYAWTNARDQHVDQSNPDITDHSRVKGLGSVTGRLGYAWDRWLGYVEGGAAFVRDQYRGILTATGDPLDSARETRLGWTIGAGAEYAFTDRISAFVEYDHFDFGRRELTFQDPTGAATDLIAVRQTIDAVKGGVNFRFWTGR